MPELPEVERGRRLTERVGVGRCIASVRVIDDPIVFEGVSARRMRQALLGARIVAAHRRGKWAWIELDRKPHVLFHFGMTGGLSTHADLPLQLKTGARQDRATIWPPRFEKLGLVFDDDTELVFTNARRLGRVLLRNNPLAERPLSALGYDPIADPPDRDGFVERVSKRKGPLKAILLDQGFCAGVGNWIADEVLYRARLAPQRRGCDLSVAECRCMYRALLEVVRRAVSVDADSSRFPRTWLFHHRWGRVVGATTARGEVIEYLTIGGRTTAWVPSRQH